MPARTRSRSNEDDDDDEDDNSNPPAAEGDPGQYGLAASKVTLSGLLNAIDGVASQVRLVRILCVRALTEIAGLGATRIYQLPRQA